MMRQIAGAFAEYEKVGKLKGDRRYRQHPTIRRVGFGTWSQARRGWAR